MPRVIDAGVLPHANLEPLPGAQANTYRSVNEDPQALIVPAAGPAALRRGWFRLRLELRAIEGEVIAPCLYPDYGNGMSELDRIDLPEPNAAGLIDTVIPLRGRLCALRLDPTTTRGVLRIADVSFEPLTRVQALWQMLGIAAAQAPAGEDTRLFQARRFLRDLRAQSLSGATSALAARCLHARRAQTRGYPYWLRAFPRATELLSPETASLGKGASPRVSIVLPVCDPPVQLLRECLDSVRAQDYANWQLCICDDASTRDDVRALLKREAANDARIRLVTRRARGHVSLATNEAVAVADGEWLVFLDHDDLLHPDALGEMVRATRMFPRARLVYTDEDKVDERGMRFDPNFKPAWNIDLLRSQNYICHCVMLDAALFRSVGGLRTGVEGAQDHDLLLRCAEVLDDAEVVHVPKVLYHWRHHAGSTAAGLANKAYATEAGRRAVEEHYARIGRAGTTEVLPSGYYRHRQRRPMPAPRVTLVIPTRDRLDLLRACIDSVLQHTDYPAYDILVVDNGSTCPDTLAYLQRRTEEGRIRVLPFSAPFNFSLLVNRGVAQCETPLVCLLNNDIVVTRGDWLDELVLHGCRREVGAVGALLRYPSGTLQHAGVVVGFGGVAGHAFVHAPADHPGYLGRALVTQNYSVVTAACLLVRRDVFNAVGGFDESLAVAFNDVDFCLRVRDSGWLNVWTPFADLIHAESASRGSDVAPERQARFLHEISVMRRRWGSALDCDPAYNPNLSLSERPFELAFPPRSTHPRTLRHDPILHGAPPGHARVERRVSPMRAH